MKLRDQKRELRQKEDKELELELKNLTQELFDLRFRSTTEKLASPARIRQIRRQVARIHTLLGERRRASETANQGGDAS